ncbi:hypothetical protein FPRO04_11813 [Fusarium proliferatum]|nr:hypothetical protein FPRO04_11813 [Fusarium proliferatum]
MNDTGNFVVFGPKANCTLELCPIEMSVYGYRPSLPANITFAALFTFATFAHAYLGFKWKTPWFMWCMILSCTHEVTGYIARILLWINPWSFGAFITQIIAITQAPVFYCAAIYVTLGQSIEHYGPSLARFPTKYFAWVFVPMDIISLILQASCSVTTCFDTYGRRSLGISGQETSCLFAFLAIAVLATLARCIFRADELKEGYQGELIKHEDLFVALEGVLIAVAVFSLFIAHPGFVFNRPAEVYYSVATGTEATDEMAYRSKLADLISESEH